MRIILMVLLEKHMDLQFKKRYNDREDNAAEAAKKGGAILCSDPNIQDLR